jgi:hypothetical protein
MGRRCTICDSLERQAIEAAIIERARTAEIIERFGVTRRQIQGHRTHMAQETREAIQMAGQGVLDLPANMTADKRDRLGQLVSAYDEMLDLREKARDIYATARGKDADRVKLSAVGELRQIVETMAKLMLIEMKRQESGAAGRGEPTWDEVREELRDAIGRHPEARAAIIEVIELLVSRHPRGS